MRRKIVTGELQPGEKLPTESALAASLGVHWQTVHRAMRLLSMEGWVERRPHHGTRVAPFARNFVLVLPISGQTHSETQFYDLQQRAFFQWFEKEHARGRVLPVGVPTGLVNDHPDLRALLVAHRVQGVIFSALWPGETLLGLMRQQDVPFVLIHAAGGELDSIFIDYPELYRLALRYLAEQGCQRVGVIGCKQEEFESHLGNGGIPFRKLTCVETPMPTMNEGFKQGMEFLQVHPDLDGLLVPDDVLARGVCMALLKLGRRVPEDLKLVCHFNKGSDFSFPFSVARVEVDPRELIEAAIARLEKSLAGEHSQPSRQLIKPRLVVEP